MLIAMGLWLAITAIGLSIGMAGYAALEGMSLPDAFMNAAMILSGMGPAAPVTTTAGKLFAGFYAIFSGLVIIIATGLCPGAAVPPHPSQIPCRDGTRKQVGRRVVLCRALKDAEAGAQAGLTC